MKKFLLALLMLPMFAFGQATTGFHRVSQVIARAPLNSVTAQVVPYATIVLTSTANGTAAAVFSDPLLSLPVPNSILTADANGNYDYYFSLNYCVTETIMSPGSGIIVNQNICSNGGSGGSGCIASGAVGVIQGSNGTGGCQPAFVQVNGVNLATTTTPNFVNSATVTVTNLGTNQISFTAAPQIGLDTNGTPNTSQTLLNFTDTSTIHFTNPSGGVESATCVTSTISLIGCLKPDGTTISISGGTITAVTATSSTLGIVEPDNTTVTISGGVISAASALIIQAEDVTLGGKFAAGSGQTLDFNSTLPAPPGGNTSVTFQNDPSTGRVSAYVPTPSAVPIRAQIIPPDTNQGIFIPFTACNVTTIPNPTDLVAPGSYCNATSGSMGGLAGTIFDHNLTMTYQWVNPVLPAGITSGNFVNAYAITQTGYAASSPGPTSFSCAGESVLVSNPIFTQISTLLTSVNASNFASTTCTWSQTQSVPGNFLAGAQQLMGLWVEYTGAPIAQPNYLNIGPYLWLNTNTNTLETQPFWPNGTFPLLVSQLPPASTSQAPGGGGYPIYSVSDLANLTPGSTCTGTGTPSTASTGQCISIGTSYIVYAPSAQALNLNGGSIDSIPFQVAPNVTSFVASPTTPGHTYAMGWKPVTQPQVVQANACGFSCSFTSPVASGDLVVGITIDRAVSPSGCGVSDSLGTSFGSALQSITQASSYAGVLGSSGIDVVSATGSDATHCALLIVEISGQNATPIDVAGSIAATFGTSIAPSVTTATANDLLILWQGSPGGTGTIGISPTYTFLAGTGSGSAVDPFNAWSNSAPTATTYTNTITASFTNTLIGGILAIKPGSGGPIAPTAIDLASVVAGVSSIIPGTNVTCSPLVSGSCIGAVTINSTGGGGTTTNALTLNNSGSGASSGATFNGSAAVTLSYNTLGAQQALTLTTTGSSGPATLSGATLNIPQYTGGGGSGTVTDSSGTTTANQLALSTTTTHQIQYSTAIPNGTTATTQTTGDNTTKVATDAFVLANASGGGSSHAPLDSIQISDGSGGFTSDSQITIDPVAHTINNGTLGAHVSIGALGAPTNWSLDTTDATTHAKTGCSGTPGAGKYCDGATGTWTTLPAGGTVTSSGPPASGDIAAFSTSTNITTATAAQVNTLIKTLTGCNTASNVYTPQGADCVPAGGGVTAVPPYWTDGTHFYDRDGYQITKPSASPVWVNSVAPTTVTAGANGNVVVTLSGTTGHVWQTQSCTTSVETEMRSFVTDAIGAYASGSGPFVGPWIYDSTNSKIYLLAVEAYNTPTTFAAGYFITLVVFTYSGSGNPSFSSTTFQKIGGSYGYGDYSHLKIVDSAGTASFQITLDGGATYQTLATVSVGTLSQCGYQLFEPTSAVNLYTNIISEVVN